MRGNSVRHVYDKRVGLERDPMRLLLMILTIVFAFGIAKAQLPNNEVRSPNAHSRVAPQKIQSPPPQREPVARVPLRSRNFGDHVYHGRLAWEKGRWHHTARKGRFGWWWDVGGVWYFYPEPIEGPPAYISDTEVADDTTSVPQQPLAETKHYTFYYRPGDLKGVPYDTVEECTNARQQAGNVGTCVLK